jgi:hypothetical protein
LLVRDGDEVRPCDIAFRNGTFTLDVRTLSRRAFGADAASAICR